MQLGPCANWPMLELLALAVMASIAASHLIFLRFARRDLSGDAAVQSALSQIGLGFTLAVSIIMMLVMMVSAKIAEPLVPWLAIPCVMLIALSCPTVFARNRAIGRALDAEQVETLRAEIGTLEEKLAEAEMKSQGLEASLADALAEVSMKSDFLASLSHELRTPLNAVIGFTDIMASELYGPIGNTRYQDYVKLIGKSGSHLLALVGDVLDYTKAEAGYLELDPVLVSPSELLTESVAIMRGWALKHNLQLRLRPPEGLPELVVDQRKMKQVLLNLISNAIKFSEAGAAIEVYGEMTLRGIELCVSDSGIGMKPDDVPRAIERFGQVDRDLARRSAGTGLGLALAKQIVELHQGSLVIDSRLGEGTTVRCIIPAQRMALQDAAA